MALAKFNDSTVAEIIDIITDEIEVDSKGEKMFVEFYSADSKKYQKTLAMLVKENETKRSTKKNNYDLMTDIIAASIISWNIEMEEGHVPLTGENAVYVLEARKDIREMIIEKQNDRKIFLQK